MNRIAKSLVTITLIAASASPALAFGCYERAYTPDHLARNLHQAVKSIVLTNDTGDAPAQLDPGEFEMRLVVEDRRSGVRHARNAVCAAREGRIKCGLESDGGAFTISQGRSDSVILRTEGELRVGEDEGFEFGGKRSDDNTFILQPAACRRAG